jgi:hypothetical protein
MTEAHLQSACPQGLKPLETIVCERKPPRLAGENPDGRPAARIAAMTC